MSETSQPLQQSPPLAVTQQAYSTHSNHGSVGALIAVLAVVTILGVIAGMIGRLCSGRKVMGLGQYDFEGWVEKKCSSCIDGTINPPPSLPPTDTIPGEAVPIEIPEETNQTQYSPSPQNPPPPAAAAATTTS